MDISFRDATAEDAALVAGAIAESSGGYAQMGWQDKQADYPGLSLEQIGAKMYQLDRQPFTWRNAVIATRSGEAVGVMLAYGIDADYQSAEPVENTNDETGVYYPVCMEAPNTWYICGMTVFEPWRNQGIGSRFLDLARSQAREQGYHRLSLIAFEDNAGSVRLYRRLGFEEIERRVLIPHPMIQYRGDALLMVAPVETGTGVAR